MKLLEKKYPLSNLMIKTLELACRKQNANLPIGPADIDGSFTALVQRGLIIFENVSIRGKVYSQWKVSPEASALLKELGINISC
jgi:hypothetical protein